MIDYSLYLVTDDPSRYSGDWLENVVAAVEGGVTCVQYRDTESTPEMRLARVRQLQDALAGRVPLIVNNEAELAAAVRAEGVHVGQSDLPPAAVRAIVGPRCEIGLSITDVSQLSQLAENACVDCLGIGPVFDARKTKADASPAMGLSGLRQIVKALQDARPETGDARVAIGGITLANAADVLATGADARVASVAIGGITLANAADVLATGVGGLAVVSAFSQSSDPFATARALNLKTAVETRAEARSRRELQK